MGWSGLQTRCKKHLSRKQSPGVCAYCLQEKLLQLASSKNRNNPSCSSSSSSSCSSLSSSSVSSCSSPSSYSPIKFLEPRPTRKLFRSRTLSSVPENPVSSRHQVIDRSKKSGIWLRLMRATSTKKKHSDIRSNTSRGKQMQCA